MRAGPPADQAGQVGQDARDRKDGRGEESALDKALRELLVGEEKVRIDPATGQLVAPGGEKSSLTDPPEPPTIL